MSLVSDIRATLSGIGALFADGVIEYRTLTSAPNATPRVYSSFATIADARCVEFSETQVQDPTSGIWYREETCQLRIPYASNVSLTVRDQVRQGPTATGASTSNLVWSVREQLMSSAGSVSAYMLYRRTPMMADNRPGGV